MIIINIKIKTEVLKYQWQIKNRERIKYYDKESL